MIFKPKDLRQTAKRLRHDQRGQSYLEFIVVLPLLMILFLAIGIQAWWWWNQTSAAVAIRKGTSAAAHHNGSVAEGYQETYKALAAPLGGVAQDYMDKETVHIQRLDGMRSTVGEIDNQSVIEIPFLGPMLFNVRARSFLRWEQFYGGRPEGWE